MGSFNIKSGGAWRVSKSVNVKSGGTWRAAKEVWIKSGGVWRKAWTNGHTVTLSTTHSYGYGYSPTGKPVTVTGNAVTVSVTAGTGSGSYTYKWTAIRENGEGNLSNIQNATSATISPRMFSGAGENSEWNGYAYCEVTDTVTGAIVRSANVTINLAAESWGGGGGGIEV